ncbi:hypothetical protein BB934_45175 (plasmid) [Microvirga ossetica]|uniref:Uncharacterized protein n=2 Tax=Microvirga ossetica TaxID=1882682 RepID=A0A1B2EZP0_9HYPH|nr:hypothetical protein BB934_45175 [Microvirga ossetica]
MEPGSEYEDNEAEPVILDGVRYRSRNEAKWAVFFQLIDWDAAYEKDRTGKWWVDFTIRTHDGRKVFAEVKPFITELGWPTQSIHFVTEELRLKMLDAVNRGLCDEVVLLSNGAQNYGRHDRGYIGLRPRTEPGTEDGFPAKWERVGLRAAPDGTYLYDFKPGPLPVTPEEKA